MSIKETFDPFSLVSVMLTLSGAVFLIRSILQTIPKLVASMSGTYIGGNKFLRDALIGQRSDSIIGFCLTLLGGIATAITLIVSIEISWNLLSIATIVIVLIIFLILLNAIVKKIHKDFKIQVCMIEYAEHVESALQYSGQLNNAKFDELFKDIKFYELEHLVDSSLSSYENIAKILRHIGAGPGADYVLELKDKFNKAL